METIEIPETENISLLHNENELVTNPHRNINKFKVINETLRSQGYGTVIIIKPTANNVKDLINNPIEIIKSTKNSLFNCSESEVKDIRVNKRKNVLVAEMKENNPAKLKQLLKVKILGTWDVICYQPKSDLFHYGVISPVAPDAPIEELQCYMPTNNSNCKSATIEKKKWCGMGRLGFLENHILRFGKSAKCYNWKKFLSS